MAGAGRWVAGLLLFLGLGFGANYFSERDMRSEIENQNLAANVSSAIGAGESRTQQGMSVFDLRAGDCYIDSGLAEVDTVDVLDCSDPSATYRVLHLARVAQDGVFPGVDYLDRQAFDQCPSSTDIYLGPTAGSWELGDRTITCLEELR